MTAAAKAMEANLWDHLVFLAKGRKDAVVQDTPDLLLIDSGLPSDTFNKIGRCALHPRYGAARMEAAINHFRKKGSAVPFTWTLGPLSGRGALEDTLKGMGLAQTSETWGMILPLKDLKLAGTAVDGLDIKRISNKQGVLDFAGLVSAATKPPNPHIADFYTDASIAIVTPNAPMKLYVGYAGDKPVATAETYYAHGVVGLSNIVADSSTAGKGYAPALLIAALRDAKRTGQTTAFVQVDAASKPIYERIGFKPAGQFTDYRLAAN
ncbi:MAG: GNAT family N-acetyltransferase [Rhodospirillaceae bacterium]|nr:GNAT family N-acetyltransferase [Rhodospirillaceae bacterium]